MMQENNPSYPFIAELVQQHHSKGIHLDNGCGRNEFKKQYFPSLIGLDVTFHPDIDLFTNGKNLPFADKSISTFTSNFVLEHVEDQELYLKEMKRCLISEGRIILSIPRPFWYFSYFLSPSTWILLFKKFPTFLSKPLRFFTHGKPHKNSVLRELYLWRNTYYGNLFKKTGFKIENIYDTCNFLSLNTRYAKYFGNYSFPKCLRVHRTYILKHA